MQWPNDWGYPWLILADTANAWVVQSQAGVQEDLRGQASPKGHLYSDQSLSLSPTAPADPQPHPAPLKVDPTLDLELLESWPRVIQIGLPFPLAPSFPRGGGDLSE